MVEDILKTLVKCNESFKNKLNSCRFLDGVVSTAATFFSSTFTKIYVLFNKQNETFINEVWKLE